MTTINLIAVPGHHLRRQGSPFTSTVLEILDQIDSHSYEIRTIPDIQTAVTAFGE